jgi:hypothetical protein
MVSKSGLDLQRRDRSGPPRNLAPSDFFHVPAKPRQHRNSVPYLAAHGKCSRSRRLNRVAVGTGITPRPPRRSVRARLCIRLLPQVHTADCNVAACRMRSSACDTHFPVLSPARALLARIPLGPRPWLHQLRSGWHRLVRRLHSYYGGVRLPAPVHHRLRLLAFPMRTGGP